MYNANDLNEEQFNAATFTGKDILLAAGPGSGKTHTMTSRILYLNEVKSEDPSSILVITFTRDAAAGMQKRFNDKSGIPMPVVFGTFHSVFYNMVKEWTGTNPPVILYDRNKSDIAKSVIRKYLGYDKSIDIKGTVTAFLHAVSIYKNTLDKDEAIDCLRNFGDTEISGSVDMSDLFPDMFRYYENIRRKSSLMDFDDMVYDCRNLLLHSKSFKAKWQNRFSHILIDEFQDINRAQYETVNLIAGSRSEIFAVGDDDQSIYGFRGSDPTILNTYLEERHAELMYLNTNYRSERSIVDSSVLVINENRNRIPKNPVSNKEGIGENVILKGFDDRESEYNMMLRLINDKKGTMAVLFRTNIEMQSFATFLTSKNVPYRIREKTVSIFDHFIMKDIYAYLQNVYGEVSEESLKDIVNKPPRYIDSEYLISSCGDIDKVIKRISSARSSSHKQEKINKMYALKKDIGFMKKLSIKSCLTYILKKIGYEKYIYGMSKDEEKQNEYRKILEEGVRIFGEADSFDDILSIKERYEAGLKRSGKKQPPDAADLMTVHASKGLEFKTVIIPDINEGNFPHGKMMGESSVEEERRIFYVAMTRAGEMLYLFYLNGKENGKTIPSRFLTPLIKNNTHKKENGLNQ